MAEHHEPQSPWSDQRFDGLVDDLLLPLEVLKLLSGVVDLVIQGVNPSDIAFIRLAL